VAVSERFGPHVAPQLHRTATWVALGLQVSGAALVWWRPRGRSARAEPAPTGR
jgi:hypothetical protein